MRSLRRALIAERAFGIELAKQWLYREPTAEFPQADLAAWRATCVHDSILELEQNADAARLMLEWQASFDETVDDVRDQVDRSITRVVVLKDIWSGAGFEGPGVFLARAGDIVVCQPSFIDQFPLTIIPRSGPEFCVSGIQVRIFEKIVFPALEVNVSQGERNA
jgi:hypothetical protein